jgi:hypothetical protein
MTETTTAVTFQAPYGNDDQHVYDPAQHHGYHWIVAHGVYNGATRDTIIGRCDRALESGAEVDAVRQWDHGAWKLITDYDKAEEMVHAWRTYVLALEAYEKALKDRKTRSLDITPEIDQKYPLQMWGMNLGLYEVTEENWHEFYVRLKVYEEMQNGTPMLRYTETGEPVPITPELAKQHVGCHLRDQLLTREAWWLRLLKNRASSYEYKVEEFAGVDLFPRSDEDGE